MGQVQQTGQQVTQSAQQMMGQATQVTGQATQLFGQAAQLLALKPTQPQPPVAQDEKNLGRFGDAPTNWCLSPS